MPTPRLGRAQSIFGAVVCIGFAIAVIAMATAARRAGAPSLFVFVPGLMVLMALGGAATNLWSAFGPNQSGHFDAGGPGSTPVSRDRTIPGGHGFCTKCGRSLAGGDRYCGHCGMAVV